MRRRLRLTPSGAPDGNIDPLELEVRSVTRVSGGLVGECACLGHFWPQVPDCANAIAEQVALDCAARRSDDALFQAVLLLSAVELQRLQADVSSRLLVYPPFEVQFRCASTVPLPLALSQTIAPLQLGCRLRGHFQCPPHGRVDRPGQPTCGPCCTAALP